MIYLELFLAFLEVGMFSFGGAYGAIPLIRDVVLEHAWMSDEQIARLTLPELIDLIKRLIEEVEIRAMQNVR